MQNNSVQQIKGCFHCPLQKKAISNINLLFPGDGILRCRGRLENTDLQKEKKYPMLFPKGERFIDLMIQHTHCKELYRGVSQSLSQIRCIYWIPQGRVAVRQVLQNSL